MTRLRNLAPDLCFLTLFAVYITACFAAPTAWWVAIGYLCGWLTQLCLDWKRNRALSSSTRSHAEKEGE